jgi:hypothetical protein
MNMEIGEDQNMEARVRTDNTLDQCGIEAASGNCRPR